ncbi:Hydroxymethylpyrimidine ABC transporter substrate-binding component [Patulibacter medicamentivorans]|uniref:Hydroxymethylpyrimidine ABC transporter substrate-binding component n=1 Tax=Patulibacter medicamentivorans TaxID=1097667 RepID=H0E589_9ACTN|nr:ABC transporter substrate-binding protein [Patulibacter medicamentivorans]EHN11150.1 Hydroxymethylpyrimidine ABC transporter substrate-binding component [Patulibacter medicamentivorans]
MTPRRLLLLFAVLATTLGLTACGEKSEDVSGSQRPPQERISLLLDYLPNADHAGIYQAQANGSFSKAGLTVDIRTPQDPASVLGLVASGKVDVGITYEPELLLARAQGRDLVAFASLVTRPLTSLISLPKAKIRSAKDLEGKTVGTAGIPYQSAYLETILRKAGVDPKTVKQVNVGFNLNGALLSGKVDATLGAFWNYEGVDLQQRRKKPVIVPVNELGVPTYDELVLVARNETLINRESAIRRLVRAIGEGYQAVRRNPDAGADPLLAANKDLDPGLQREAVSKSVDAFFPADAKKPWGWMETDDWASYAQWMLDQGLLKRQMPLDNVLTTDFLAGEGAGEGRKTPGGQDRPAQKLPGYRGE